MAKKPASNGAIGAASWPATKIEMWPIEDLVPYAKNARLHPPEQIEQIAASMRRFGMTTALLVAEDGTIIAGHGRVLAAQKLGIAELPVMVARGWSDEDRRLYTLADNRLAETSEWDPSLLKIELDDLRAEFDGDVLAGIGFSDADIADILPAALLESGSGLTDPDDVPEPQPVPVSRPGDIWLLGDHRIVCGSSTDPDSIATLMGGELADLLWTDPPWNVNYGAVEKGNAQGYKPRTILNDHMDADKWADFVSGFCRSFKDATKPGAPVYVVMSAQEWPSIDGGLRAAGFHWSSTIIWKKDRLVLSRKDYHTQYEPIWYGWNDAGPRLRQVEDRKQSDVWEFSRPSVSELHPTTKPVELIVRALANSTLPGDLVLDLFGGSGSTLIACEQSGRRSCLMELDPKYVDVIVCRWQEFSGKTAVLAETGETFADVKAARLGDEPLVKDAAE